MKRLYLLLKWRVKVSLLGLMVCLAERRFKKRYGFVVSEKRGPWVCRQCHRLGPGVMATPDQLRAALAQGWWIRKFVHFCPRCAVEFQSAMIN